MEQTISQLMDLTNRTVLVTGGANGIGKGIVERLHEAGANLVIADRDEQAAEVVADELNALRSESAIGVGVDVSQADDVERMVARAAKQFSSVDILVNNAGIFPNQPLSVMTEDDFMKVIDVNLRGVFLCTKAVSQQMIAQGKGGKIINITSIDALHPSMVGLAHYDASKHGVWGFTKNAALELAQHKIWVNAIAPGGVATPGVAAMSSGADAEQMKAVQDAFLAQIPMHRMGEPDEIGRVTLFLASELASYMTGSQIVVDGGALLN